MNGKVLAACQEVRGVDGGVKPGVERSGTPGRWNPN